MVVKLGGSLFGSSELASWLAVLADSAGAAVIVPGGGPFAEAVRDAQQRSAFGDGAAHRMAILAMEQFGLALAGIEPRLLPARSRSRIAAACRAGITPIWMAADMTFGAPDIPESWDVTSDSLAVWLAAKLGLARVVLVKSTALPAGRTGAEDLAVKGIVDPMLPGFLARTGVECRCVEGGRAGAFAESLAAGEETGTLLHARGS